MYKICEEQDRIPLALLTPESLETYETIFIGAADRVIEIAHCEQIHKEEILHYYKNAHKSQKVEDFLGISMLISVFTIAAWLVYLSQSFYANLVLECCFATYLTANFFVNSNRKEINYKF